MSDLQQHLCDALIRFVVEHENQDVQRFAGATREWGTEHCQIEPLHLTASDTLQQAAALSSPETADFLELFITARSALRWEQSYSAADSAVGDDMLSNYGYAELIGKQGPFISTRVRAGIAVYGPNLTYPPHRHQAEEIYALLAGSAVCSLGDAEPALRGPGDVLYHAPQMPHGLRTTDDPLVIAYLWQNGDLREKPTFV